MAENTPEKPPPSPGNSARIDPMVGKRLASYEILSRVARGGMGVVYRARHVYIDRIVALKVLDPALAERKDLIERFRTEAQSLARVEHENVIKVIDILEEKGVHFIVMDFAEGVNLRVLVKEKGAMNAPELLSVARQSADALYAAHKQGILHRDIKPENLILSSRGRCKLTDFGLAGDLRLISEGHEGPLNFGTPAYAAPEVLRRMTPDVRSDIFSWGATMYHLATSEPPFGATGSQQIQLRQKQGAELLEARRGDLPRSLCALIQDCLNFHPAERPADFREVLERLPKRVHATAADTGAPTTGLLTSTVPTNEAAASSRLPAIIAIVLTVVALGVLATVIAIKFLEGGADNTVSVSNLPPAINTGRSANNRPAGNTNTPANNTPRDGGLRFTEVEDAFNAAELSSQAALRQADYKSAYEAWDGFLKKFGTSSHASKATAARNDVVSRVTERRENEYKNAEAESGKALAEGQTADALAIWERYPAELLQPLYPGENDSLIERIESQKQSVATRESNDLTSLLEKADRLRDSDKLLDERTLLEAFIGGRTKATQEKVQARQTRLRQLLEARHQRALELVEAQRKLVGQTRAEASRKAALGIEALAGELTARKWEKAIEGLSVLIVECQDSLVDKLLEEYRRDVELAGRAERALAGALEKQARREVDFEIKVYATGQNSGRVDTYTGKISNVRNGEFTVTDSTGAHVLKIAQLNPTTVRALLKEGSIDDRCAMIAWLFAQGKTTEAKSELAKLMRLSGVPDVVAAQLAAMDVSGSLGSNALRLLRYFAAREKLLLPEDFFAIYGAETDESRLLSAQAAARAGDGDAARKYLDLAAQVPERELISPVTYGAAAELAVNVNIAELRRWVEIESWTPPGKTAREPYNPRALVVLAQKLLISGLGPEARKLAAQALALDASDETAWRMLK